MKAENVRITITREEVEARQAAWEDQQTQEPLVKDARINEDGRFELHLNMDMSNFAEVVGPRKYFEHLGSIGIAEIIEPPKTIRSVVRNIRKGRLVRLGSIKEILGGDDGQAVLDRLDEDDKRHHDALMRHGKGGIGR